MRNVSAGVRKARKRHPCHGCDQIDRLVGGSKAQIADFGEACECKGYIEKGEKYKFQVNTDGGDIFTFKATKECDAFILKWGIWEETF